MLEEVMVTVRAQPRLRQWAWKRPLGNIRWMHWEAVSFEGKGHGEVWEQVRREGWASPEFAFVQGEMSGM